MYKVKESDWKLFRKLLPGWQERFMERLLGGYAKMIAGQGLASDRFWKLQKRLKKDVRKVGVCADMRRSVMVMNLRSLLYEGGRAGARPSRKESVIVSTRMLGHATPQG